MRSDNIALDMGGGKPSGESDTGLRLGTILQWDVATGNNIVEIEGEEFNNLACIQGGIGIKYAINDVVMIMRKQSRLFILGKLAVPGQSAGSVAQTASLGTLYTTGAGGWSTFPDGGPTVTAYIGSSKTALVIWSADVMVNQSVGEVGWAVSGATNLAAGTFVGTSAHVRAQFAAVTIDLTVTGSFTIRSLNKGVNTFTMQYKTALFGGTGADYGNRSLTVIPL